MIKRLTTALAAVAALSSAACTTDTNTGPPEEAPPSAAPDCDPELDGALRAWAEAGFSGSVAITAGGDVVCEAGYGLADEASGRTNTAETVFGIGSVTKAFTAAAVFDLADEGLLTPDDRVGDHLPGLHGPVAEATLMQLMTHTSGLGGTVGPDHEPVSREDAIGAAGAMELAFAPGTGYRYSNAGYTLLALVIEELSGSGYREHAMTRLLSEQPSAGFWDGEPAAPGPRAVGRLDDGAVGVSGQFGGPHWALDGNGGLAMSMPDLAAWAGALFGGRVVSPESAQTIAAPQVPLDEGQAETPGWVASDATVRGEPFLSAAGGGGDVGHDVMVVWVPNGERAVAVASNGPDITAGELLTAVGPALAAGEPLPLPDTPGNTIDPGEAAAIVGTYRLDTGGSFDVSSGDDGLRIAADGADAVRALFPPADGDAADAATAHEDLVRELLAAETDAGREELAAAEELLGPVTSTDLTGTIVAEGELRTYVTLGTAGGAVTAWYALDDEGGVQAALVDTDPPALPLLADGAAFRPDDPAGSGPPVTVAFADDTLTVSGSDPAVTARRDG